MEFRKMVPMILYAGQWRRHRHQEHTFALCGRRGWDALREQHWNLYITICKTDSHWEFDVWCRAPTAGTQWQPGGMGWGGSWERCSRGRGDIYTYGRFMSMYGKKKKLQYCAVIICPLKLKKIKTMKRILWMIDLTNKINKLLYNPHKYITHI